MPEGVSYGRFALMLHAIGLVVGNMNEDQKDKLVN